MSSNTTPECIRVLHGPSCNKLWMPTSIICCTITWWSWLFMCCNLQLPTCFLNIVTYPIGAYTWATKFTKAFASFRVKTNGACGFVYNPTPCWWSHKCCITLASCRSLRTSIVSLSPKKYFKMLSETFFSTCMTSKVFSMGNSYKGNPLTSLNLQVEPCLGCTVHLKINRQTTYSYSKFFCLFYCHCLTRSHPYVKKIN